MKLVLRLNLICTLAVLAFFIIPSTAFAQGTAFTYQGQLQNNGVPASGTYNLQFTLYTNGNGGTAVAGPVTNSAVAVTNGLFTVMMDFGSGPWNGQTNWLQIAVETNGAAMFTTLTPWQPVTPVPYSIYAGNAAMLAGGVALGSGSADSIANEASDAFIGGGYSNIIQSYANDAFIGGGYANAASGQAATVGGGVGNTASDGNTTVAGGWNNIAGGYGATVGGGKQDTANGDYATVGGGALNTANGSGAFIGGGGFDGTDFGGNTIEGNAATIGGGLGNTIQTGVYYAFIGGGYSNIIQTGANGAFIGGGGYDGSTIAGNMNQGNAATIGGGLGNTIQTGAYYAFIGGGHQNSNSATAAVVSGGAFNSATGSYATVGGGFQNIAKNGWTTIAGGIQNTASGQYATVPGGANNTASGEYSFAAGDQATASQTGSFVWADGTGVAFGSTLANSFNVRASGGFYFYSSNERTGVTLPGGSGSWASISDRNVKNHIAPVNPETVLDSVTALPISHWSYKTEQGVRHIGPMAQDFYAAFKVGEDDRHITEIDEGGVALAAIQGLNEKSESENRKAENQIEELESGKQKSEGRIQTLENENTRLEAQVTELQTQLAGLQKAVADLAGKSKARYAANAEP